MKLGILKTILEYEVPFNKVAPDGDNVIELVS
jgi:hypothetical protein